MTIEVRFMDLSNSLKELLKLYYDMFVHLYDIDRKVVEQAVKDMGETNHYKMATCILFLLNSFDKFGKEVKK